MIKYNENMKKAYFNGYTFNRDDKTNYFLSTRMTESGKRQRLHVYVWEYFNGKVPDGCEVHHKDMNKFHNEVDNLEMMTNKQHMRIHGDDHMQDEERRQRSIKNLNENARPKAIEWHGSDAGIKWHKEHYENMKDKLHAIKEYECDNCGDKFEAKLGFNRFCSNNCKSAWRRKEGLDNVEKECVICGKTYIANKYAKGKTCSRDCVTILKRQNAQGSGI